MDFGNLTTILILIFSILPFLTLKTLSVNDPLTEKIIELIKKITKKVNLSEQDLHLKERKLNIKFSNGVLLYSIPKKMELNKNHRCVIAVSHIQTQIIKKMLLDYSSNPIISDNIEFEDLKPTDTMEVIFKANRYFSIEQYNTAVQVVNDDERTEWNFDIRPLSLGKHRLKFIISAVFSNGKRQLFKEIVVEVGIEPVEIAMDFDKQELDFSSHNKSFKMSDIFDKVIELLKLSDKPWKIISAIVLLTVAGYFYINKSSTVYVSGKLYIDNKPANNSDVKHLSIKNLSDVNTVHLDATGKFTFNKVRIPSNKKILIEVTFQNNIPVPTEEISVGDVNKEDNTIYLPDLYAEKAKANNNSVSSQNWTIKIVNQVNNKQQTVQGNNNNVNQGNNNSINQDSSNNVNK